MHILSRGFIFALLVLGAATARAKTFNAATNYVLRVRRVFPSILTDAIDHNINLINVARRREKLIASLNPDHSNREYVEIQVEQSLDPARRSKHVEDVILNQLRDPFTQILKMHGGAPEPPLALLRANLVELLRSLVRSTGPDQRDQDKYLRASAVDLLRFLIWSDGLSDVATRVARFDAHDLKVFEPVTFDGRWRSLLKKLLAEQSLPRDVFEQLQAVRDQVRREVAPYHPTEDTREIITLAEMAPDLAMASGEPAGDCSSRECVGYTYSTFERKFAILDRRGRFRGAVGISRVRTNGRLGYYLNVINGRRLNKLHVMMVLNGLRALLSPGEALLILGPTNIFENINFPEVRSVLLNVILHKSAVPIEYLDPSQRDLIERFSFRPYLAMANHREAYEITDDIGAEPFTVHTSAGSRFERFEGADPTRAELGEAMIEAIGSGRPALARGLWTMAGGTAAEARRMTEDLTNLRGDAEAEYLAGVDRTLNFLEFDAATTARWRDANPLFIRGRRLASDRLDPVTRTETFDAIIRYLSKFRTQVERPEIRAWIGRLSPAMTQKLLRNLLDRYDASLRNPREGDFNKMLLQHVITPRRLKRRARSLHARGYRWKTLIETARLLNATPEGKDTVFSDQAHVEMMIIALRATRTPAEFSATFLELVRESTHTLLVVNALGRTFDHFIRLNPNQQQIERVGGSIGAIGLIKSLRPWLETPPRTARALVEGLEKLEPVRGVIALETLVQAVTFELLPAFFRDKPTPEQIGRVRTLALRAGSLEERSLLSMAVKHHLRHIEDLADLLRADSSNHLDQILLQMVIWNLDHVTDLYRRASVQQISGLRDHTAPRLDPLWAFIDRNVVLMNTTSPEQFLTLLRAHPVSYPGKVSARRLGSLNEAQVQHFVDLAPSIAQVRGLLALTGEIDGVLGKFTPLVRTLDDLKEMVQPLTVGDLDIQFVREAFLELITAVIRRTDAPIEVNDLDLDELTAEVGLDHLRHELPFDSGLDQNDCAVRLGSTQNPSASR